MRRQGSSDLPSGSASLGLHARPSPMMRSNSFGLPSPGVFKAPLRRATPCRLALQENVALPSEETRHRRKNSLSSNLEGLNFNDVFPSENDNIVVAAQPEPCDERSAAFQSKTARRRAEYDSKRKGVTFNQRKHMSPSYLRRLERRQNKEAQAESRLAGESEDTHKSSVRRHRRSASRSLIPSPFEMASSPFDATA